MENKVTETKVKEILEGVVSPLFDKIDERMKQIADDVDAKVAAAVKVETKAPVITVEDNFEKDAKGGFKSFSHFCKDIALTDMSGGRTISKELSKWDSHVKAAGTGLSEGDANYAGFLVPEEFRNTLMVLVEETNDILPLCAKMPMNSNIIKIPYVDGFDKSAGLVYGGIRWYWAAEEGEITSSRLKVDMLQMELHTLVGMAHATEQLIADSPQSVEALLQNGFRDGLNFVYNNVLLRGTGAGQPLGIFNAPCAISVAVETGQTVSSPVLFENLAKMFARSTNPSKSVWTANIALFPYLCSMSLQVGTGGIPVWMPAGGLSGLPYATLFGRPIYWNDHASDVGTVGDISFCDWSQYYIGSKAGTDIPGYATSIHLKFEYLQQSFRFSIRTEGRPAWKTYLTPPQATSSTRSPIVLLAVRS
jgi:HK97 family phage major capsid protein